jgi:hypothetical protein
MSTCNRLDLKSLGSWPTKSFLALICTSGKNMGRATLDRDSSWPTAELILLLTFKMQKFEYGGKYCQSSQIIGLDKETTGTTTELNMSWTQFIFVMPLHKDDSLSHSNKCQASRNFLTPVIYTLEPKPRAVGCYHRLRTKSQLLKIDKGTKGLVYAGAPCHE